MPTKITAIYENPKSPEAFEAGHGEQIVLAKAIPGVQRVESAKVWPKEDGSPAPAYRVLDLHFTDYDAAAKAVTSDEASAFVGKAFELATGGVRLLFVDVEEV
ncbi:EthD family reductase [Streptomyces sp. NPDC006530]|uniref:EthD family reductase n=1 Tax=Streptomyces sp. NPDC006530 TaxID=3364750 RepID=UPI003696A6A5